MVWLQSNEAYDLLADYDHASGIYRIASRSALADESPSATEGLYGLLSSVFVALYRFDDALYLRIGEQRLPLTDDTLVTVAGAPEERRLMVVTAGREIARVDYALDLSEGLPDDPTPFVEDEDFDFGLLLANIASSRARKNVLLGLD